MDKLDVVVDKTHNFVLFLISIPIMAYCYVLELSDLAVSINREYADKLFLKRIDIRPEEFDEFVAFKRKLIEKRNAPKVEYVQVANSDLKIVIKDGIVDVKADEPTEFYPDGVK